jgi:hypothetical protein
MDMLPVKPERKAQLDDYAQRHGQDAVAALDDVLADYFAWEKQDYVKPWKAFSAAMKTCRPVACNR